MYMSIIDVIYIHESILLFKKDTQLKAMAQLSTDLPLKMIIKLTDLTYFLAIKC